MDTNKMREQFEEAYERGDLLCMDGPYDNPRKNQALSIWIASREAVVVEMPEPEPFNVTAEESLEMDPDDYDYLESRHGAQYSTYRKCRQAVEAQGLRVKP